MAKVQIGLSTSMSAFDQLSLIAPLVEVSSFIQISQMPTSNLE